MCKNCEMEPYDRLATQLSNLRAVEDLMISADDLHIVSPDHLGCLIGTICDEMKDALENLSKGDKQ